MLQNSSFVLQVIFESFVDHLRIGSVFGFWQSSFLNDCEELRESLEKRGLRFVESVAVVDEDETTHFHSSISRSNCSRNGMENGVKVKRLHVLLLLFQLTIGQDFSSPSSSCFPPIELDQQIVSDVCFASKESFKFDHHVSDPCTVQSSRESNRRISGMEPIPESLLKSMETLFRVNQTSLHRNEVDEEEKTSVRFLNFCFGSPSVQLFRSLWMQLWMPDSLNHNTDFLLSDSQDVWYAQVNFVGKRER